MNDTFSSLWNPRMKRTIVSTLRTQLCLCKPTPDAQWCLPVKGRACHPSAQFCCHPLIHKASFKILYSTREALPTLLASCLCRSGL